MAAPDRPRRPRRPCQADWLPTPPLSVESPLATPHRGKRRRISEEDEEEKQHSGNKHVSFARGVPAAAEDAVPNVARQKGWKRPRTLDKGGEEDGDKELPRKVQVTTNLLSMMLKEPCRSYVSHYTRIRDTRECIQITK